MSVKRSHEIALSQSGVWRILRRLGVSRLPTSQRYRRHQDRWTRDAKPQPGHQLQIDVKFIAPRKGSRRKHSSVHRDRRLHAPAGPAALRPAQPEGRDPVRRRRPREAPVPGPADPDRQRFGVPGPVPLAGPRPRHRARLDQAGDAAPERHGRALAPHRRRGVLPDAGRRGSLTTRRSLRASSRSGRTSTISIVRMVASADRRRTNDCAKRSRPRMSQDIVSRTRRGVADVRWVQSVSATRP